LAATLAAGALAVPAAAAGSASGSGSASANPSTQIDAALEWYDATAQAVAAGGATAQVTNNRSWAIAWLAAARALRDGGSRTYQQAALASAVHESLVTLIPGRSVELDASLATTLGRVPDGRDKDRGVAAGQREARSLLAQREGDGLDPASVSPPFPSPPPDPGVWQPTPPAFATGQQAGNRFARPFLLDRADRYRSAPPPALGSTRYRRDLAEVQAYGAVDSAVRTQAQLDTATFWYGSSLTLYTGILRAAVAQSRQSLAWRAALVAIFHVALVDTQIATSDTKYAYLLWRPVTAIRNADIDGDPATSPDPDWTPVHVTPAHPDYPSGHNTYSGAAEQVLTTLVGPRSFAPYTIDSPSQPGATRTYTDWHRPTAENIDARVWSGIHTRSADEAGVLLGRQVAGYALSRRHHLLT
jgi:hypothetical protein